MSGSELDFRSLEQEFNLIPVVGDNSPNIIEDRNRDEIADSQGDSDKILRLNIERANHFLDLTEQEFQNGSVNARTLEACSKLIAEVTNAANSLKNNEIQKQTLDLKERTLSLKDFEVKNKVYSKDQQANSITNVTNNNVVLTDRESLLKMLQDENIIDVD